LVLGENREKTSQKSKIRIQLGLDLVDKGVKTLAADLTRYVTQRSDADFDETFFIESIVDRINYYGKIFCGTTKRSNFSAPVSFATFSYKRFVFSIGPKKSSLGRV
jgi:hypothetical protein